MDELPESSAGWRWFIPTLLVSTAALKLVFALVYPGFSSGDDLEIVESGARYAVGFPYEPWALRSLFHPILLAAPWIWLGNALGFHGPRAATLLATIPTTIFSTAALWLVWRLTRVLRWSPATGRVTAFLFATHPLALAYSSMPYPRPISTALILGAFLVIAGDEPGPTAAVTAGLAVAAAMAVRWSEGLMILPVLAFAARRGARKAVPARVVAGFVAGFLVFVGLFDLVTCGTAFGTLIAFVRFSLDPLGWGSSRPPRPWYWYGSNILGWAGPLLVLLALCAMKDRRVRFPLAVAAAAVALLSFSPMKQPRYLQVAIPFLAMAAALGWETLRRRLPAVATVALLLALPFGLERSLHLLRRKSLSATAAAGALAGMKDPPSVVALEQAWAYGDRLSLGSRVEIHDLTPRKPLVPERVLAAAVGAQALGLYEDDSTPALERALERDWRLCSYFGIPDSPSVVLFLRRDRPCPVLDSSDVRASGSVTSVPPRP